MVKDVGFDSFVDDFGNVDGKSLNYQDCEVWVRIIIQHNPDIAGGVHDGKDDSDEDDGDKRNMFGYAGDEACR